LRASDERAGGKATGFVRREERELGAGEEVLADTGGERGGFGGREVAPAAARRKVWLLTLYQALIYQSCGFSMGFKCVLCPKFTNMAIILHSV